MATATIMTGRPHGGTNGHTTKPGARWAPCPQDEQTMRDLGAKWEVRTIRLADIDWEMSGNNNARLDVPIDDALVMDYGIAMERGDIFPRVVVWQQPNKKYLLLSGNHRGRSAELAGFKDLEAYVVETKDPMVVDILPRLFNRRVGKRSSNTEALQHAMYAIRAYNLKPKDAAAMFGIKVERIYDEQAVNETQAKLDESGVDSSLISRSVTRILSSIGNQNALKESARVVIDAKLGGQTAQELVKEVNRKPTELQQLAAIHDYRKRLGIKEGRTSAGKVQRPKRSAAYRTISTVEKVFAKGVTLSKLQITEPEDCEEFLRRLHVISEAITKFLAEADRNGGGKDAGAKAARRR